MIDLTGHHLRARRKVIADISFNYKYGEKIPRIEYTPEENATWAAVYDKVKCSRVQ